ncbi:TSUP family transporter, partial [Micromonospora sp.]
GGLPMPVAIGTSLVVIAMKSFAGLAGYLWTVDIHWPLALAVTAAAVLGSLLGGRLTSRVPAEALRLSFGWFVLVMGAFVLVQQLPGGVRADPALWTGLAGLAAGAALAALTCARRSPAGVGRTATRPAD